MDWTAATRSSDGHVSPEDVSDDAPPTGEAA